MSKGGFVGEEVTVGFGVVVSVRVGVDVDVCVALTVGVIVSVFVRVGTTTGVVVGEGVAVAVGVTGGVAWNVESKASRIKTAIRIGIQTLRNHTGNVLAGTMGCLVYPSACKSWFRLVA